MHLSTVGYVHTFFGLVGVVLAFYMLIRNRKIDPKSSAGMAYFVAVTSAAFWCLLCRESLRVLILFLVTF